MSVKELLEQAIERKGGNVSAAAKEMKTTRQTVYNWLRGVTPPMGKTKDVAAYCDVDEDYVLAMILVEKGIEPAIFEELATYAKGVYLSSALAAASIRPT